MSVKTNGRIVYVEPNDLYGDVNGNQLTPDYTDYSIYCNLIVEYTNRFMNGYVGNDATNGFSLMANLGTNSNGVQYKPLYKSFFQGKSEQYNYLSTNYSDIHFSTIEKTTFIEGLQISGIDISYANRMSPLVVINMVDVRGSGLFGREESTHDISDNNYEYDENGDIIDNIYSGFMSYPYPRYRLHIKGYYGRAVTYQLTCSNFVGKFDSATGNFNITATFIGYEYGCLNDLPLSFVMAAPLTKSGKAYWDAMKNSPEWNLFIKEGYGDEAPMLMHDFFKNVKAAVEKKSEGDSLLSKITDTNIDEINAEYTSKYASLINIQEQANKFVKNISDANPSSLFIDIQDEDKYGDRVIVILAKNSNVNITKEAADAYNTLGDAINLYSESFPNDTINISMIPCLNGKEWNEDAKWRRVSTILPLFFKKYERQLVAVSYNSQPEKQIQIHLNGDDGYEDFNNAALKIKILQSNYGYTLNSYQSNKLYETIISNNKNAQYPYASVIVMNGFQRVNLVKSNLEKKKKEYEDKINDGTLISIKSITGGISPYIGNYFKMVFCHVDTFLHTIKECVNDIYYEMQSGYRMPEKLGIYTPTMTDIPNDVYHPSINKSGVIPPFPGIYRNYEMDDASYDLNENAIKRTGWVGDVKGEVPWREQTLVDEYYNALRMVKQNTSDIPWSDSDEVMVSFSLLPCFMNDHMNKKLFYTRDGIAYYVSIMSAWILGLMNKNNKLSADECNVIGCILAKVIYDSCTDKEKLKRLKPSANNFATELYNTSILADIHGNDEIRRFEFATSNTSAKKHRLLKDTGDTVDYVYMQTKNRKPLIPLNSIDEWDDLPCNYSYVNDGTLGTSFIPNKVIDGEYVIGERADNFIDSISNEESDDYMNSNMFAVWLDSCNVENMQLQYDEYKESGDDIGNIKRDKIVKSVMSKYWLMDDNYVKYHTIEPEKLVGSDIEFPDYDKIDDITDNELNGIKQKIMSLNY